MKDRPVDVVDELVQNRKPSMDVPPRSSECEPDHCSHTTPSSLTSSWSDRPGLAALRDHLESNGMRVIIEPAAPSSRPSPWLTVKEGAKRARCGPRQLYEAVQRGTLRAIRVGRDGRGGVGELRFRVEWIDAWLESMPATGRSTQ